MIEPFEGAELEGRVRTLRKKIDFHMFVGG
jgi:hypothetical protein